MKVLLLSAYSAQSHQAWCDNVMAMFPECDWTLLTLPGRYFNWRIRGNALSWGINQREVLEKQYDLVLATSMVDCATLRGLVPNLVTVPWVVYFHENQFEYPVTSENDHTEPKMVSLYNALCADKIVFNSHYNYQTFITGLDTFLKKMPDEVPKETIFLIKQKSEVIPVPVNIDKNKSSKKHNSSVPILLWNHRWEYDKGPQLLYNVINELHKRKFTFKLNLIGQQFRVIPDELKRIKSDFSDSLLNYGFIESMNTYKEILESSDFVLSTSLHDFQGLAILDAVAAGCIPVVPSRLSYTEIFHEQYRYESDLSQPKNEAIRMADKIIELNDLRKKVGLVKVDISKFSIEKLRRFYSRVMFDK